MFYVDNSYSLFVNLLHLIALLSFMNCVIYSFILFIGIGWIFVCLV